MSDTQIGYMLYGIELMALCGIIFFRRGCNFLIACILLMAVIALNFTISGYISGYISDFFDEIFKIKYNSFLNPLLFSFIPSFVTACIIAPVSLLQKRVKIHPIFVFSLSLFSLSILIHMAGSADR